MTVSALGLWIGWVDEGKRDGRVLLLYLTILEILTRLRAQKALSTALELWGMNAKVLRSGDPLGVK